MMDAPREFANHVVQQLREAGYVAYWAGGCVRDGLLGIAPKDYDVATSAAPEQIRDVFGRRRTLAIGAAFGVITVLGRRKSEGQIEVATFREDAAYSDGRHPDGVTFSTPEQDAQRRDFTINGLFYDPVEQRVIDFVGGEADLKAKILRAIGNPDERIDEDKLRMLRAVRFAATYELQIDPGTMDAVRRHASEIKLVSAERIAQEMRRMLGHPQRAKAVKLLFASELLGMMLPEIAQIAEEPVLSQSLQTLDALGKDGTFCSSMAVLLRANANPQMAGMIASRWRLTNDERDRIKLLLSHETTVRRAKDVPWPELQGVLIREGANELVNYCAAVAQIHNDHPGAIAFCREKLAMPREVLDPPPLVTGDDLKQAGIPPGKQYQELLRHVRDAQLEGEVVTYDAAIQSMLGRWEQIRSAPKR